MSDGEFVKAGYGKERAVFARAAVETYVAKSPGTRSLLGVNRLSVEIVADAYEGALLAMDMAANDFEQAFAIPILEHCLYQLIEGGRTGFMRQVEAVQASEEFRKLPNDVKDVFAVGYSVMYGLLDMKIDPATGALDTGGAKPPPKSRRTR